MKLTEIASKPDGTYAGVKFSRNTLDNIQNYMDTNNIPNQVEQNKIHSTLLYSRKYLPNFEPIGTYEQSMMGTPTGFDVFPSGEGEDQTRALVLKYDCPQFNDRHTKLMKDHEATWDYPTFLPHITMSYDIGDMDITNLPPFEGDVDINSEYKENLNLDWASEEGNKD